MAFRFRVLRADTAAAAAYTGPSGQLLLDTEAKKLYIHDGATVGGILVGLSQAATQALIDTKIAGLTINSIQGLTAALAGKASTADLATLQTAMADKADKATVQALSDSLAGYVKKADLDTALALKADKTALDSGLALKADKTTVDALSTQIGEKADQAAIDTAIAGKADKTELDAKADKTAVDALSTAIDGKASTADLDTALAGKADQDDLDALTTTVQGKADAAALTSGLATKADKAVVDTLTTEVGKKVSKAELYEGDTGIIKASLLPSYVDDVLEFANVAAFPAAAQAEKGKIYVATDTSKIYRWSGSTYVDLASPAIPVFATDAQVKAMSATDLVVSPHGLSVFAAELGFTKVGDDWVLDEGEVKSSSTTAQ